MAREKYITPDEAERLSAMDLGLNPRPLKRGVSHIYDRISAEITAYLGGGPRECRRPQDLHHP